MKQKLRLWDSYAFLATNHTRDRYKRKPVDSHLLSYIYPRGIHQLSSIYTVYENWITTVCLPNNYWTNTVESLVNTCCGYVERACVWPHAKAPARSGLGLALGIAVMLLQMMCLEARAQRPENSAAATGEITKQKEVSQIPEFTKEYVRDTNEFRRIKQRMPEVDLKKHPLINYRIEKENFTGLKIGDRIPDWLLDLPLCVVNHPDRRDTITLREYGNDGLIVMDLWASWCAPCVASMDKWEKYMIEIPGLSLIGVHLDYDYKAQPFITRRGWKSPCIIGEGAFVLQRMFLSDNVNGRAIWIKDGRFIAVTTGKDLTPSVVKAAVDSVSVEIPMDHTYLY